MTKYIKYFLFNKNKVIDSYIKLINIRNNNNKKSPRVKEDSNPSIAVLDTFFFTKYKLEESYDFNKLNKYFAKKNVKILNKKINKYLLRINYNLNFITQIEVENVDLLLLPLNLNNSHWSLAILNIETMSIVYVDSLKSIRNMKHVTKRLIKLFNKYLYEKEEQAIKSYEESIKFAQGSIDSDEITSSKFSEHELNLEKLDLSKKLKYYSSKLILFKNNFKCDVNKWNVYLADAPTQKNLDDCGVFLCKYIEYISRNQAFDFNYSDMVYFRKLISAEILLGKLLSS